MNLPIVQSSQVPRRLLPLRYIYIYIGQPRGLVVSVSDY